MQQLTDNITQLFSSSVSKLSPLVLPFLGFWFVYNWQVVFIMLFEINLSVEDRIIWAEILLDDNCNSWIYPLILAGFSLVVAPIIETLLVRFKNWLAGFEHNQKHNIRVRQAEQEKQIAEQEYNTEYVRKYGADVDVRKLILDMTSKASSLDSNNEKEKENLNYLNEFISATETILTSVNTMDVKAFYDKYNTNYDNLEFKMPADNELNKTLMIQSFHENPELITSCLSAILKIDAAFYQNGKTMTNYGSALNTAVNTRQEALSTIAGSAKKIKQYLNSNEEK